MKKVIAFILFAISMVAIAQTSTENTLCSFPKSKTTQKFSGKFSENQAWSDKYQEMESEKASVRCLLQRINKELNRINQNSLTYDYQHNSEVLQGTRIEQYQELQDQIDTIEMKEFMLSAKEIEILTLKFKNLKHQLQLDLKQLR